MLPQIVADEIFNLQHHISDQALDHIADELHLFGCVIDKVIDNDLAITIYFNGPNNVEGEIRVDRLYKAFEIIGRSSELIMPVCGDWNMIVEYLRQLTTPQ